MGVGENGKAGAMTAPSPERKVGQQDSFPHRIPCSCDDDQTYTVDRSDLISVSVASLFCTDNVVEESVFLRFSPWRVNQVLVPVLVLVPGEARTFTPCWRAGEDE